MNDTAIETTFSNMKKQKGFPEKKERANGDSFWKKLPIEKLGDSTLKFNEDEYNINANRKNVFTDTTEKPLKMLSELDRVMYENNLTSLNFDDYIPKPDATNSGRSKYIENNLDENVNKFLNRSIYSKQNRNRI